MKRTIMAAMLAAALASFGGIEVLQDHPDALYRSGEEAAFTVSVKSDSGELLKEGKASWKLDNFGSRSIGSGSAELSKSNPFTVRGRMDEEGFMRLTVSCGTNKAVWGVGYDVEKIRQNEPRPADFDEYWASEKARLEREVPLDAKMVLDEERSNRQKVFNLYRVSFATFNGKRVYGFLAVPKDSSRAPFRVRVTVPGAGPGAVTASTDPDQITLVMNVHCFEPEKTPQLQKARMGRQNAELAARYSLPNKSAYCALAGISASREDYWYHDVMLGINRAVDWVCARPDVDLSSVAYYGSSQGGGFGLFLNYLNTHFTRALVAVCAITGHYGHKQGRQEGWPRLIAGQPAGKRAVAERYAAYFDGVNFAAGIKTPIRFIVGFSDNTCPPANVYAAYNVCSSPDKAIVNLIGSPHGWFHHHGKGKGKPGWLNIEEWLRPKKVSP